MIVLVLVVLGLTLGSFVNAFVWRLHERRNWVNERSECPHCHHVLEPRDLVPVISWLALRGKCRYCHKPIPDTPITELVTPALFVLSYYFWPVPLHGVGLFQFVLWQLMTVLFVILAAYDLRWYILPDKVVFPVVGLSVLWTLGTAIGQHSWQPVLGGVSGVLIISGLFYLLFVLSKEKWIGFGDVKLGIALGLLAGGAVEACMVLFFASFIGVLVSAPLLLTGRASRKTQLPFGPLLLAATVVVRLFGPDII
ncbi:MAG TPA: prepilin peptidase, partial [Candidatus Saccharimonadales bacterium]